MLAGLWPSPIAEFASAVVSIIVVGLLRAVWKLQERVSRLEGIEESRSSSRGSEDG